MLEKYTLLLVAGGLGCSRNPPESPRIETGDVQIRLGTAGVIDAARWNILRVRAQNTGGDFRGVLEVRGIIGDQADGLVYRMQMEVPGKGAAREHSMAVRPEGWTGVQVALKAPGWSKTWDHEILSDPEARARILICETGSMDWTNLLSEVPLSPCPVAHIAPDDLPGESLAYDPFAMIILKGVTLAGSPPGVAAALRRWVERGGILVAFPGPEWAGGVPGTTLELLGVTGGAASRRLASGPRNLVPLPGTERILGEVAFLARPGCGLTTCFSSGPGAIFPERTEDEALHHAIAPSLERLRAFNSRADRALAELEMHLPSVLPSIAGIQLPSRGIVALMMTAYIAVGLVLPWRIFTRRRRREWAYAVMLVVSALSMVAIARHGLLNAAQSPQTNELSVARMHDSGSGAEVTTYAAAISPTRREGAFEPVDDADGEDVLAQPFRGEILLAQGLGVLDAFIDARQGGSVLEPMMFYPNALRAFRFEHGGNLEDILDVQRLRAGSEVLLSNRSEDRLLLHVYREGRCFDIGDVGPGKNRTIDFSTIVGVDRGNSSDRTPRFNAGVGSRPSWRRGSIAAEMADVLFETLIEALEKSDQERPFSLPILLARSNRPVLPVGVAGFRRRAHTVIIIEP